MAEGLDHIVHAVGDLDAAGEFYRRAGFTVGARNVHPWGTHNRVVQLDGFFIELLTVAESERIVEPAPRAFSFGAFHRDYLAAQEGLAMLLLKSGDARVETARFKAGGIGDFDTFGFSRSGKGPAGTPVTLAFSLAFAEDTASPGAGFAVCQHHHPEHFWNPAAQHHANGARRLAGVVMVADQPAAHRAFLEAWTGAAATTSGSDAVAVQTPNGLIEIVTPAELQDRYKVLMARGAGAQFAALRFEVDDIGVAAQQFAQAGLEVLHANDALVLQPGEAFGAALVFAAPHDTTAASMA